MWKKTINLLEQFCNIVSIVLMSFLSLLVLQSVLARYIFGRSDPYTQELTRLIFPWLVFIGSALVFRKNANLAVTIVSDSLPRNVQILISKITLVASIVFLVFMISVGAQFAFSTYSQVTSSLALRKTWFYLAIPVGAAMTLVFAIDQLLADWEKQ